MTVAFMGSNGFGPNSASYVFGHITRVHNILSCKDKSDVALCEKISNVSYITAYAFEISFLLFASRFSRGRFSYTQYIYIYTRHDFAIVQIWKYLFAFKLRLTVSFANETIGILRDIELLYQNKFTTASIYIYIYITVIIIVYFS